MIVYPLEREADLGALRVHARDRLLEVREVNRAVLLDQRPHEPRAHAGRAGVLLAAGGAPSVVDEHLGDAAALPAARRGAEPEVPVLTALDEARVVAADLLPQPPAIERGHVDR